jgi:hypothetical protein
MQFPNEKLFLGDYALQLLSLCIGTDIEGIGRGFLQGISSSGINSKEIAQYFLKESLNFSRNQRAASHGNDI